MKNIFNTISCLGYTVYADSLNKVSIKEKALISTINQYSYCIAKEDVDFKESLKKSEILLPDGVAIVWATRLLTGKRIKKIAGADIHSYLLNEANLNNGSCFYLGATDETLGKIIKRVNDEYPNIKVGSYSPPYKPQFSDSDNKEMLKAINDFKPDVLFVGMTAPKQEKWAYALKDQIDANVICSIGAVFDFYAGTVKRPGKLAINLGMEWLLRLLKEPRRLWRRYLYYGPIFLYEIFMIKFKRRVIPS
ncbi:MULTISPECIES: WecB/TagA/CpsF family glycosyltransferase [Mucilaginibacter]|jgi:N-acetylglucosaminyldiphosphoundecaprenol N-acetyl-beta-D-mannosaminyltransferase|uniref:WecB/TagA/CpsF family glycosyltransferase n=1 Tax=Mucilaginibacter rubeus TaxID=2027860 RepID=A0AAE6MG18_9SPHI|nr:MULTISPECIES: WecB/TagA/CpsF family glycosyltransferase [Mucilaginibacter]NVM66453.1 N-acetylglucosaminyldiphosphoundecaprenol N-acetyl-beta-D-mannosaminyltransferase [Mucilaginibacter sp. SG538B]QEM02058.1 WecB/TagA/CpsF family glycosyltransferase [Mucilaginibacter rubeus]QEM14683.1 WecB/TagA/CpsF family glycosyltransferase [Mucilaginibacter gossypii]QTE42609.1 WecB/TagA/CpsF family glycosyltransferase [Mucilaginibacter rubeus]QTE49210.1 WecB/TagA/CpsF family glycosyltransferase [Mucilagin